MTPVPGANHDQPGWAPDQAPAAGIRLRHQGLALRWAPSCCSGCTGVRMV